MTGWYKIGGFVAILGNCGDGNLRYRLLKQFIEFDTYVIVVLLVVFLVES